MKIKAPVKSFFYKNRRSYIIPAKIFKSSFCSTDSRWRKVLESRMYKDKRSVKRPTAIWTDDLKNIAGTETGGGGRRTESCGAAWDGHNISNSVLP